MNPRKSLGLASILTGYTVFAGCNMPLREPSEGASPSVKRPVEDALPPAPVPVSLPPAPVEVGPKPETNTARPSVEAPFAATVPAVYEAEITPDGRIVSTSRKKAKHWYTDWTTLLGVVGVGAAAAGVAYLASRRKKNDKPPTNMTAINLLRPAIGTYRGQVTAAGSTSFADSDIIDEILPGARAPKLGDSVLIDPDVQTHSSAEDLMARISGATGAKGLLIHKQRTLDPKDYAFSLGQFYRDAHLLEADEPFDIAVVADVHANRQALEAVLKTISTTHPNVKAILNLGDLVGYNGDPKGTVEAWQAEKRLKFDLQGNHEDGVLYVAAGMPRDSDDPNMLEKQVNYDKSRANAQELFKRSAKALTPEQMEYLKSFDNKSGIILEARVKDGTPVKILAVHGSLVDKNPKKRATKRFTYVDPEIDPKAYAVNKELSNEFDCLLFGHTHLPLVKVVDGTMPVKGDGNKAVIRFITNPGSVGQSRDVTDLNAHYNIISITKDGAKYKHFSVPYNKAGAEADISKLCGDDKALAQGQINMLRFGKYEAPVIAK